MSEDSEKRPKKKKRVTRKTQPKSKKTGKAEPVPLAPPLNFQALSAAFKTYEDPEIKRTKQDIEFIGTKMQEYLSAYILIGYTVDGKNVNITYAPTPQDLDSLSTGLQRFILEGNMMRGNFPPGSEM